MKPKRINLGAFSDQIRNVTLEHRDINKQAEEEFLRLMPRQLFFDLFAFGLLRDWPLQPELPPWAGNETTDVIG